MEILPLELTLATSVRLKAFELLADRGVCPISSDL